MSRSKKDFLMNKHDPSTLIGLFCLSLLLLACFVGSIERNDKKIQIPPKVEAQEVEVIPTITPTPTATPILSEKEQIIRYVVDIFGEDAERGLNMLIECENKSLNPLAENWNGNGTWDFGLWQINSVHGYSQKELSDYKFNTQVAYQLFKNAGYSFSAWTCAEFANDRPFWK